MSNHRKRKRSERLQQYGIDLPDIPGLPVTLVPLHMQAIRQTCRFFRNNTVLAVHPCTGEPLNRIEEQTEDEGSGRISASILTDDPLQSVLQRVHQVSAAADSSSSSNNNDNHAWKGAIEAWLAALYREVRDGRHEVPVAALKHIDAYPSQEDAEISTALVRLRACTHLMGRLLRKSADARKWALESYLGRWLDGIQSMVGFYHEDATNSPGLWIREIHALWCTLDASYGTLYPRVSAAVQKLEQMFPWLRTAGEVGDHRPDTHATAAQLRQWRDTAMQNWAHEEASVRRYMRQIEECLDVLVPRMGRENEGNAATVSLSHNNDANHVGDNSNENDEEEEDFDWEEGFGDEDEGEEEDNGIPNEEASAAAAVDPQPPHTQESHAEAVERTLAVLNSTLQTGQLEIAFDDTTAIPRRQDTPQMVQAKEKLTKLLQRLKRRHTRLQTWTDALTRADDLTSISNEVSTRPNGGSLVRVSAATRRERRVVLQSALDLKADVVRLMARAQRLGLEGATSQTSTTAAAASNPVNTSFRPSQGRSSSTTTATSRAVPVPPVHQQRLGQASRRGNYSGRRMERRIITIRFRRR